MKPRLERITVPSSVKWIGGHAFSECISLAEVTLREGLNVIEFGAFFGCISLANINVPPVALEIDVQGRSCQLLRATMPGITSGSKLIVSKWMQSRSLGQLEQAKVKVIEILGRPQLL